MTETEEKTTTRGTRRRRTTVVNEIEGAEVTGAAAAPAPVAAEAGESAAPEAAEAPKPAKRRGRPAKAKVEAAPEGEAAPEAAPAAAPEAEAGAEAAPAPEAAPADAPATETSAPAEGEAAGGRRRRGRSKKVVTEDAPAATDAPAAEGEAAATAAEGAPADAAAAAPASAEGAEAAPAEGGAKPKQDKKQQQQQSRKERQKDKRQQRQQRSQNSEVAPSVSVESLMEEDDETLVARAIELEISLADMSREDLVKAIASAVAKKEGFLTVSGILDTMSDGYGFLRCSGYLPAEHDVYVPTPVIRRNNLRRGDMVVGMIRPARENEKYPALQKVFTVNDIPVDQLGTRVKFADLTPVYPDERLTMEHGKHYMTARVMDLVAPIGKGQRGLIVSPPKAGKTTVLKDIAASIAANNPEVHLMCLLVDERPEEVTDMQRSIKGEVISSTFDMPCENHIAVAELVIERAKRLVENGADVVILLDSITRLARAYNLGTPASGRILSGGVDSSALYPPKRFLGAARNIEHGGSLTILASALIDTGSKMDEVIFEEFKGTGNMELKLDRQMADRRIFPAIDTVASGTRKEELLLDAQWAPFIWNIRRILANRPDPASATETLIKNLKMTETNEEFLMRAARKSRENNGSESLDV